MDQPKPHTHAKMEFSKITDQIYIGTNLCCTTRSHIKVLMDEGINAEIDLEKERQDSPPEIDIYLWLPVEDHHAPSQDQLGSGVAMLEQAVVSGRKIYVHCKLGHGRSPTLVAAYFVYHGNSVEKAIDKIKTNRPEIHLEDAQIKALHKFAQRMRDGK